MMFGPGTAKRTTPKSDHQHRIDGQPAPVLLQVAIEVELHDARGTGLLQVVRIVQAGRRLLAEVPQQLLLRHGFRHPAECARPYPPEPAARNADRRALAALPLGIRNHFLEAMDHAAEEAGRRLRDGIGRLIGHFAVGLVSLRSDRHEKDVHWLGLRYRGFAGSRSRVRSRCRAVVARHGPWPSHVRTRT